ncbi:hypothetical protein [Enterococcus faecalis]|uniref:hypothetical protein n=1 Tax=Enterococcus faecalis TaxID=1351 RepID=UPI00035366DA|nr:hypothetical protein [Enterococcus faecalis]EPI34485.1 hypothetical protein D349_00196 [Enterococcus faecalis UP2S-6]MCU9780994.1 hypothetical protein [Enterococcus faecalis]MDN3128874.1 hypothetical protein [Enterococcus faecalis]HCW2669460.1 hypothetical protein [Enterococcus faecalis]
MYVPVIVIGVAGILTLVFQILYFLKDYTYVTTQKRKKTYLIPNIIGLAGSVVLIVLSVMNLLIINSQL